MKMRALAAIAAPVTLSACNMDSSPATENPTTGLSSSGTKIVPASQAVRQADLTGTDLGTMTDADVAKVMRPGPHCSFSYVSGGKPVLIAVPGGASGSRGYIKLHGMLVELETGAPDVQALSAGTVFRAEQIAAAVAPVEDRANASERKADLVFALQQGLRVGYGGFYNCAKGGLPRRE
jgi:hypothetical protein